jgi:hypothetical protein
MQDRGREGTMRVYALMWLGQSLKRLSEEEIFSDYPEMDAIVLFRTKKAAQNWIKTRDWKEEAVPVALDLAMPR